MGSRKEVPAVGNAKNIVSTGIPATEADTEGRDAVAMNEASALEALLISLEKAAAWGRRRKRIAWSVPPPARRSTPRNQSTQQRVLMAAQEKGPKRKRKVSERYGGKGAGVTEFARSTPPYSRG